MSASRRTEATRAPASLARRAWLRGATGAGLALGLAGCGFHLRGPLALPFTRMRSNLVDTSALDRELKAQLKASGVTLQPPSGPPGQPLPPVDVVLDVLSERREQMVLGMTTTGQVNELQLRMTLRFRVRTPQGRELIPEIELVQERVQSFNESLVVGMDAEQQVLYNDMQSDIVRQVMRRLAAIKGL